MKKTTTPIEPDKSEPRLIWSMKQRVKGEWQNFPLNLLAGKTLRQVNEESTGKDIVAEFIIAGEKCYLCGTPELKARMLKKGKAVTFEEALVIMETVAPADLDMICPPVPDEIMESMEKNFPGATLVSIELPKETP